MNPSLKFADLVLEQLRSDLERLGSGAVVELNRQLGKGRSYFQRLLPENLRLRDTLVAIRFVGFTPLEYIERLKGGGVSALTPPSLIGFFYARRSRASAGKSDFAQLENWVKQVKIDTEIPDGVIDFEEIFKPLGLRPNEGDLLRLVEFILRTLCTRQTQLIGPKLAQSLAQSLGRIARIQAERGHLDRACRFLDSAFCLDKALDDLGLRLVLYKEAANLATRLGLEADLTWLRHQTAWLASLTGDFESAVDHYRKYSELLSVRVGGSESLPDSRESWLKEAAGETADLLRLCEPERKSFGVRQLDLELGHNRAFWNAVSGARPLSLRQWHQMLSTLKIPVTRPLSRRQSLAGRSIETGGLFRTLIPFGTGIRTVYSFQAAIRDWAEEVEILSESMDATTPLESDQMGLSEILNLFEELTNNYPIQIESREAARLGFLLARLAFSSRQVWQLKASSDFLDAAFYLLDRLPVSTLHALAYRTGFRLALDLGHSGIALALVKRAQELDLQLGDRRGMILSINGLSYLDHLEGRFSRSVRLRKRALALAEGHQICESLTASLYLSIADTLICKGDLTEAEVFIEKASAVQSSERASYLAVRGEHASHNGQEEEALALYAACSDLCLKLKHSRDLILCRLRIYGHYKRFGRSRQAERELRRLLSLARSRNVPNEVAEPIEQLLNGELRGSLRDVRGAQLATMKRIQHPHYDRKA